MSFILPCTALVFVFPVLVGVVFVEAVRWCKSLSRFDDAVVPVVVVVVVLFGLSLNGCCCARTLRSGVATKEISKSH